MVDTQKKDCPVMNALSLIGGKWKLVIMHLLADRSMRFGELRRAIGEITQQMLSKQLKEMERDGLVRRKVFEVVPPHVEYSLTTFGKSGMPIIKRTTAFICQLIKRQGERKGGVSIEMPANSQAWALKDS